MSFGDQPRARKILQVCEEHQEGPSQLHELAEHWKLGWGNKASSRLYNQGDFGTISQIEFSNQVLQPLLSLSIYQQAKQSFLAPTATESSNCIYVRDTIASVVKFHVLHNETRSVLAATPSQFTRVHLTIVDPPKVTKVKIHRQN